MKLVKLLPTRALGLALLVGTVAVPALPSLWGLLGFGVVGLAWLSLRPPRREAVLVGVALGLAGAALTTGWIVDHLPARRSNERWVAEARSRYEDLLTDLDHQASVAAFELPPLPSADNVWRRAAFRDLSRLAGESSESRTTLLLLNPDGYATVWAGAGLLHEVRPEQWPASGLYHFASYTAATVAAVRPLDDSRRPWRVVAGQSLPTNELPFDPPLGERRDSFRWSLAPSDAPAQTQRVLRPSNGPMMLVEGPLPGARPHSLGGRMMARLAWGLLGLVLIALAVLRSVGRTAAGSQPRPADSRSGGVRTLALAGALAWGLAAGVPIALLPVLVLSFAVAFLGLSPGIRVPRRVFAVLTAGVGLMVIAALALAYQEWRGPLDLGSVIIVGAEGSVLRLALWNCAFGVLCLARPRRGEGEAGNHWAWIGLGLILLAAGLHDFPALGLGFLVVGGGAAAVWIGGGDRLRDWASVGALALLATLAAAVCWEITHRVALRGHLKRDVVARIAPPSGAEVQGMADELQAFFDGLDVADSVSGDPRHLGRQDLALTIWRGSPLARSDALSALVVEPPDGEASAFSYGLPLKDRDLDRESRRWGDIQVPGWRETLIMETVELHRSGRPWAVVRYWFLPQPGFGIGARAVEELEVDLLRGGPAPPWETGRLPGGAVASLYLPRGRALFTPWPGNPPLESELLARGQALARTPVGRAWGWARHQQQGPEETIQAVYLPLLLPIAGLERAATHSIGTLFLLALGVLLAVSFALPRTAFRGALRRNLRSYSKRLIILFTLLLIVPLLLLNLLLFRSLGDRLQEDQRAEGEAALTSAQRVLVEEILALEPGSAIDTALNEELFRWLSQVVHHEVNVYWESSFRASSKPELFNAGLLPRRIPGEIFSRLVLVGYDLASRTNRAGQETTYLELYAPLSVPGVPAGQERLFISIPLLAQQEEVTAELVDRARQALLITTTLVLLLVAVGMRLARSFTTPLMQIVEGTDRIASGASSLGFRPAEPELAALAQAVDDMARRIAKGRSELLREKQVIERMVENITSGIVSLDHSGRVLMRNRVAADLLEIQVGESLDKVAEYEHLAPVASFLTASPRQLTRTTAHLRLDERTEREWTLLWVPVPGQGDPAALLVVEDQTEVLRGERLEAWAEMARIIAHEIKNPLTPIRLSTEHLRKVYSTAPERFDEVFERCTRNILTQVQVLYEISSEFSTYSHIPRTKPQLGDLVASVADCTEGYRTAPPPGVHIEFSAVPGEIRARFDGKLLGRAVCNLVENALRASADGGEVSIRVEGTNGWAQISVADQGPGVEPDHLSRIFDPYFSTHSAGTGLGLPIARRIAEEHGGEITARNRVQGGLEVTITMPTAGNGSE